MGWDAQTYDAQFSFVTDHGAALLDLLAAQPGERVLDLGCGTGHQAAELSAAGVAGRGPRLRPRHDPRRQGRAPRHDVRPGGRPAARRRRGARPSRSTAWCPTRRCTGCRTRTRCCGARARCCAPAGGWSSEQGGAGNVALLWDSVDEACAAQGLPRPRLPWVFPTPGEQAARLERAGFRVRLLQHFDRPTPPRRGRDGSHLGRDVRPRPARPAEPGGQSRPAHAASTRRRRAPRPPPPATGGGPTTCGCASSPRRSDRRTHLGGAVSPTWSGSASAWASAVSAWAWCRSGCRWPRCSSWSAARA